MIKLEIVTPEKKAVDETVDLVTIPTASGEIGILPNHAPVISTLEPGVLSYAQGGATTRLVISDGFVEIGANKVSVLANIAESADEVNLEAARLEKAEAEKALAAWGGSEEDFEAELEKLGRSEARLQLGSGR